MRLMVFTGSDAALREHALRARLAELAPAALDLSEHDMSTPDGRQQGAAAVARGPLAGEQRVVVWRRAEALTKLTAADPVVTLLGAVGRRPRVDVALLVEGSSFAPPASDWGRLLERAKLETFEQPLWWQGSQKLALARRVALQEGVELAPGAAEALLEQVGADSRLIRSALARLALLAEGPITAATVRAGVVAEALDALALVKAALAGERALALRAAAAVRQRRVKVGDLLLVAQQEALQQMVLVETLGSSEQQVMQILGWRSSKRVYHARRELSLDGSLPQAMLTAAMAMAALIGRGVPLTPQQVVSRLLATCFSGAA